MRWFVGILLLVVYTAASGCTGASTAPPTVDKAPDKPPIGDKKSKTKLPQAND